MSEKLSALMDNELPELDERRMLNELERDEGLRATWERYHVIRAALRKEDLDQAPIGVTDAVIRAIGAEPARHRTFATRFGKAAGGLAIAASVAAIAVANLPSMVAFFNDKDVVPVAQTTTPTMTTVAGQGESRTPAAVSPLNAYLVEHGEVAPSAGMGNLLPAVRTVNHDNTR